MRGRQRRLVGAAPTKNNVEEEELNTQIPNRLSDFERERQIPVGDHSATAANHRVRVSLFVWY